MTGKLYHRIKKHDGKWSWVACTRDMVGMTCLFCALLYGRDEEE